MPDKTSRLKWIASRSVILCAVVVVGCAKSSSPSSPDQPQDPYLGTWTGVVRSDVIGPGAATIVLDSRLQSAPTSFALISGRWMFVFPNPAFTASGTVSGGLLPDGSFFVLQFSRSMVPCPGESSGVSEKGRSASLIVSGNRMTGDYMDNGCPGGKMDLTRK